MVMVKLSSHHQPISDPKYVTTATMGTAEQRPSKEEDRTLITTLNFELITRNYMFRFPRYYFAEYQ